MPGANAASAALAIIASVIALGVTARPAAAGPSSLADVIFGDDRGDGRHAEAPPVARYQSEGETFVFDRSSDPPLLKFEDSQEVWALIPVPAPRGDTIYRNDMGEPVLRATRLGGLTLFLHARAGGSPAALEGSAQTLRLQAINAGILGQKMLVSSVKASRFAKHLIEFDAPEVTPGTEALYADAAAVAAETVKHMSRKGGAKEILAKLRWIVFNTGRQAGAVWQGATLQITVVPHQGLAGRPSSGKILAAFKGR